MSRAAFVWSSTPPSKLGYWFYRASPAHEESIVRVFRGAGETELSYMYRDLDADPEDPEASVNWIRNVDETAQWCYIPLPRER